MAEQRSLTLRKTINGIMCELMVKTISDQVYINNETTLTMALDNLNRVVEMKANVSDLTSLEERFNRLIQDAPEEFDTLKEIADYIDSHQVDYDSVIEALNGKVDKVEGKGLSTNDFSDDLYNKLDELYTKVVLDGKFDDITQEINGVKDSITNINNDITNINQTLVTQNETILAQNTRIENLENGDIDIPGGFHIVDTIEERNELLVIDDGKFAIVGMLVYVRSEDKTYQLKSDDIWQVFTDLTTNQMDQIVEYVNTHMADRSVYSVEDGVEYLTLN